MAAGPDTLRIEIRDDGRGGAAVGGGSGPMGLIDRVEALAGRLTVHSPPGAGTTVTITLPLHDPGNPQPAPSTFRGSAGFRPEVA